MRLLMRSSIFRIIPAHAGQTPRAHPSSGCTSDHPRTCGANTSVLLMVFSFNGSSPHMRGKPRNNRKQVSVTRIIPAHAGQTSPSASSWISSTDHPRTCGANTPSMRPACPSCGSSPHMRGKQLSLWCCSFALRIIPAHAGQTIYPKEVGYYDRDHPRTCGANGDPLLWSNTEPGSSPHMRGKLPVEQYPEYYERIIPAHAGQTSSASVRRAMVSDHPRTCGANTVELRLVEPRRGSSPHMRGKRCATASPMGAVRIIPAHAGQTTCMFPPSLVTSDHPRTCGAN